MKQVLASVLVLLTATCAWGDGKVISAGSAPVVMPDQQALIVWDEGVETLVIESHFSGKGDQFAWILPLPAAPEIEETTAGVLPTLQVVSSPPVQVHVMPFAIIAAAVVLPLALVHVKRPMLALLVLLLIFVVGIGLPALGTASGRIGAASSDSVRVHDRRLVGAFDVATIGGDDVGRVLDWMRGNGFTPPAGIEPVVSDYVDEGWVFVVMKMQRPEGEADRMAPHPMVFRFDTDRPVYPMRLTGVGQDTPLDVDLFVAVRDQQAAADGFELERSGQLRDATARSWDISVQHPELSRLVRDSMVLSRLTATLQPADLDHDIWIDWQPFEGQWVVRYSRRAAMMLAGNVAVSVLLLGLLIVLVARRPHWRSSYWHLPAALVGAVALLAAVGCYIITPRVEGEVGPSPGFAGALQDSALNEAAYAFAAGKVERTADGVKQLLADHANYFTGQPVIEEDSPGNFRIEQTDQGEVFIWYDRYGAPHRMEPVKD